MSKKDFHVHTNHSDGTKTPNEVVDRAVLNGISCISITDHDTTAAYTQELIDYSKSKGINLVSGVEFSSWFANTSIHVLGYGIHTQNVLIKKLEKRHVERRNKRNFAILERLRGASINLDRDRYVSTDNKKFGRAHIANDLIAYGFVSTYKEAFSKYLGDTTRFFVKIDEVTLEDTIGTIHEAGGEAVLAHPHIIKNKSLLPKLLSIGFNGVECYYGRYPRKTCDEFAALALKHGLFATGGSDYHGHTNVCVDVGTSYTETTALDKYIL